MFQNLSGWHFLILLVIILLLFGAPRLPALARSLGQSMRIFKGEVKAAREDDQPATTAPAAPASTTPANPAPPAPTATSTPAEAKPSEPGDTAPRA